MARPEFQPIADIADHPEGIQPPRQQFQGLDGIEQGVEIPVSGARCQEKGRRRQQHDPVGRDQRCAALLAGDDRAFHLSGQTQTTEFGRDLQTAIKPPGQSTGVFAALLELWQRDGLSQRELVAALDIEQATMANTLARMERDGLIVRKADSSDGRLQRIWLTDQARGLRDSATAAAQTVNTRALADLSEQDRAQFIALLGRVLARMTAPR